VAGHGVVFDLSFISEKKINSSYNNFDRYAVAQLVEALLYNTEGRQFDSRSGDWNLSLT
jgi:hypothetical protein